MNGTRSRTMTPLAIGVVVSGVVLAGIIVSAAGADAQRQAGTSAPSSAVQAGQPPSRVPDIYFAATRQPVADAMLQLAGVRATDVVFDLGSGDGRIVILAAQKYGARGVGVEIDRRLVETARRTAREGGVEGRVQFVAGDLFDTDVSKADVVTLYLSAGINASLEEKLRRELKPGARIVSHQFPIGGWTPDRTVRAVDGTDLYLWTVR